MVVSNFSDITEDVESALKEIGICVITILVRYAALSSGVEDIQLTVHPRDLRRQLSWFSTV